MGRFINIQYRLDVFGDGETFVDLPSAKDGAERLLDWHVGAMIKAPSISDKLQLARDIVAVCEAVVEIDELIEASNENPSQ